MTSAGKSCIIMRNIIVGFYILFQKSGGYLFSRGLLLQEPPPPAAGVRSSCRDGTLPSAWGFRVCLTANVACGDRTAASRPYGVIGRFAPVGRASSRRPLQQAFDLLVGTALCRPHGASEFASRQTSPAATGRLRAVPTGSLEDLRPSAGRRVAAPYATEQIGPARRTREEL